jgi:hypothetical protein
VVLEEKIAIFSWPKEIAAGRLKRSKEECILEAELMSRLWTEFEM